MNKSIILIRASLLLLGACAPREGIEVRDAWTRAAAQGENGAVYFVIHNYSGSDDALVGVSSDAAGSVEIHSSEMDHDVMQMHMVNEVPLAPGEAVEFVPGGLHVMLVHLNRDLQVGGTIGITLHFRNKPDVPLTVPVQAGPEEDDD
jgi:hypothetical protein